LEDSWFPKGYLGSKEAFSCKKSLQGKEHPEERKGTESPSLGVLFLSKERKPTLKERRRKNLH